MASGIPALSSCHSLLFPSLSYLLDSPVDWGQVKTYAHMEKKGRRKGRAREEEKEKGRRVFQEDILVQIKHGYTIIWFVTADNQASSRSNNEQVWWGQQELMKSTLPPTPFIHKQKYYFHITWDFSKEWMTTGKPSCMAQLKTFLPLRDKEIKKQRRINNITLIALDFKVK